MSDRFKIRLNACCVFVSLLVGLLSNVSENFGQDEWPNLRPKGVSGSVPSEVVQFSPFDIEKYYSIPVDENREQIYLRLEACCYDRPGSALLPLSQLYVIPSNQTVSRKIEQMVQERRQSISVWSRYQRDVKKRYIQTLSQQRQLREFLKTNENADGHAIPEQKELDRAIRVCDRLDWFFEELNGHSDRKRCFISTLNLDGQAPYEEMPTVSRVARIAPELLKVRYAVGSELGRTIDDLGGVLKFVSDRQMLAGTTDQRYSQRIERDLLEKIVQPILHDTRLTIEDVNRLIEVLEEHRHRNQAIDPVLEAERFHLVRRRLAFDDLRYNRYMFLTDRPIQAPAPKVAYIGNILPVIGDSRLTSGRFRTDGSKELIEDWKSSGRPRKEVKKVELLAKRAARRDGMFRNTPQFDSQVWKFLGPTITSIQADEFKAGIKTLTTRYQQIEAACQQPYPESTKSLAKLDALWTNDDTWKNSFIFLMYSPQQLPGRAYRTLDINAWLCLAAIRKWQLEHEEKNPSNLTEVLEAANISTPVIDPFSGKQLIMRKLKTKMMIHSIGPDSIDTNGKKVLKRSRRGSEFSPIRDDIPEKESQKGDICFELWISNGTRSR